MPAVRPETRPHQMRSISVTDTTELRDAQLHPENYKDLMVRITGYSALFTDMSPFAQNEIIRRDELC